MLDQCDALMSFCVSLSCLNLLYEQKASDSFCAPTAKMNWLEVDQYFKKKKHISEYFSQEAENSTINPK